ncbi:MAG: extracellular solute-binding protein [Verrucomicrobia bacterium]|jgi:molybdate transport system substrate-binding protein|nr:extracellular solute-binding protein [Verrucomicrobiota bacterium]
MKESKTIYENSSGGPWFIAIVTLIVLASAFWWLRKPSVEADSKDASLVVYCAAGIRKPVEEAAKLFEKAYDVEIRLDYGSSGELEGKIELEIASNAPRCDVYIPADVSFVERAQSKGLTQESLLLAQFELILAISKDSNFSWDSLDQLHSEEIPYGLCDEKAGAGKKTREVISATGIWEETKRKARVTFPRVTELAGAIQTSDTVQAGFIWDTTAKQFGLKSVSLKELKNNTSTISANITTATKNPTWALRFARFLAAPEKGAPLFEKHHFTPTKGDAWELEPEIVFYCGGVNREAVTQALDRFQKREGCLIKTQFAGCGTIVGSIQSGRFNMPDLFMTCDVTYMAMVQSDFNQASDVSSTRVCMLVRKGNPKNISTLKDLARSGIGIGTTDPQMSTLGALSHAMFEDIGINKAIQNHQSIIVTAPTAHELILQMEGHDKLDVALVYEANCQHLESNVEIVPIDHPLAVATQNIAAARHTKFPHLMARLMKEVLSTRSQESFLNHGFQWEGQ